MKRIGKNAHISIAKYANTDQSHSVFVDVAMIVLVYWQQHQMALLTMTAAVFKTFYITWYRALRTICFIFSEFISLKCSYLGYIANI